MSSKQIASLILVAIIFGAGGFFEGIKYQQSKAPKATTTRTGGFAGGPGGTGRRFGNGGTFLAGQVLSVSGSNITVKLMNGGSQIAVLAPSTQYNKSVSGSASDVTTGENVVITGNQNSDGSITAQTVQIRSASSTPSGIPPARAQ